MAVLKLQSRADCLVAMVTYGEAKVGDLLKSFKLLDIHAATQGPVASVEVIDLEGGQFALAPD